MSRFVYDRLTDPIYFVLDPGEVIRSNTATYGGRRVAVAKRTAYIVAFYCANLLLYALPLTLAGFGVGDSAVRPPGIVAVAVGPLPLDAVTAWNYAEALLVNSAYLFALSAVTFVAYHVGVLLTRTSRGILQSLQTVAYSTGVYLAVMFTITWVLSTSPRAAVADDFLLAVQAEFVYVFIDLTGQPYSLPGGRPEAIPTAGFTTFGTVALAILLCSLAYFLYSLYLGARLNHRASRTESLVVVVFVCLTPALYVVGSILTTVYFGGLAL